MKITLNISTCPNDTFMFDALVHNKIDTKSYVFDLTMLDIDQLNKCAIENEVNVTKISYALYPTIAENYQILRSGSAIGSGNGPLLVSRRKIYPDELHDAIVAIPGEMTTANLLLDMAFPNIKEKKVYPFDDIASAILDSEVDCGVLIHEQRFEYEKMGLKLVTDLGEQWQKQTGRMIPLGGIVIQRKIRKAVRRDIEMLIRKSIQFALANPTSSYDFVKSNAKGLNDETIYKHIDMFVNDFSVDLTENGVFAVKKLLRSAGYNDLKNIFV